MALRPGTYEYQGQSGRTRAPSAPARVAPSDRAAAHFAALPPLLTFTLDLEEHRAAGPGSGRYVATTRRALDMVEAAGGRATVFALGEVAEAAPDLIREIARRGHEVACHGHRHLPLGAEPPERARADLARAKALLEDLAGRAVLGYRAPMFSLTARTAPWVAPMLRDLGFAYSSSVLPAWNPLHGYPGAPREPFLWSSADGPLEIPCPLGQIGPLAMPFLGGMYLRYLLPHRFRAFSRQVAAQPGVVLWTYCHPYDLDEAEDFGRVQGVGLASSLMLWMNRRVAAPRLAGLLQGRTSRPFAERLPEIRAAARAWTP